MEFKEVANFLGLKEDEIKTIDDFKAKFDTEFIRTSAINEDSEPVKKILGRTFGTIENELKKFTKAHELDIDFDSDDLKGKRVNEKYKFVLNKFDENKKTIIDDLTAKAGQGNDDKVKELESKLEKQKTKLSDVEGLLKNTSLEFETFKGTKEKEIKNVKLNIHKNEIFAKANFLPEVNEYAKKGFLNEFQEKYQLDLDENEKPVILNKDGKQIPNPKVTGTFYQPNELLLEELVKAGMYKLNPKGGTPAKPVDFGQATQTQAPVNNKKVIATRLT